MLGHAIRSLTAPISGSRHLFRHALGLQTPLAILDTLFTYTLMHVSFPVFFN